MSGPFRKDAFQEPQWIAWVATRPQVVQDRIQSHPPSQAYRLYPTGHKVWLHSYDEFPEGSCDTCQVTILREDNPDIIAFHTIFLDEQSYRVFGVKFENLVPWETAQ